MEQDASGGQLETPGGGSVILTARDGVFTLRVNGRELMSSRAHRSEEALAELVCAALAGRTRPRVVVGGLGMGFTLRAALDRLPPNAWVVVVERFPEVVAWNRGVLADLAHRPLADRRVRAVVGDVVDVLQSASRAANLDAVLLDVDNGPRAVTLPGNRWLYGDPGVRCVRRALRPGGVLGVWSADEDPVYARRVGRAGFAVETHRPPARGESADPEHVVYLARRG